jgi:hypothetical protein
LISTEANRLLLFVSLHIRRAISRDSIIFVGRTHQPFPTYFLFFKHLDLGIASFDFPIPPTATISSSLQYPKPNPTQHENGTVQQNPKRWRRRRQRRQTGRQIGRVYDRSNFAFTHGIFSQRYLYYGRFKGSSCTTAQASKCAPTFFSCYDRINRSLIFMAGLAAFPAHSVRPYTCSSIRSSCFSSALTSGYGFGRV